VFIVIKCMEITRVGSWVADKVDKFLYAIFHSNFFLLK
jgi:hypothetical protein